MARHPSILLRVLVPLPCLPLIAFTASAVRAQTPPDEWHFNLGAAITRVPAYAGSAAHKTRLVPTLSASQGRFFIGPVPGGGPLGIGATLYHNEGLRLGAAISADIGMLRKESDDVRLAGLGDIKRTRRAHLFASYSRARYTLRAGVAADIGGNHLGTLATLEAEALFRPAERWSLAVGPSLTWGSRRYMQTVFGIDSGQSARSGRALYEPGAGASLARLAATLSYRLDEHWSLGTRMSLGRLQGDAAASPLTEQRSQNSGALFASYRFWRLPEPAKEPLMIQRRAVFLGVSRSGKNTPTLALTNALLRVTALALGTLTRPKARTSLRCV